VHLQRRPFRRREVAQGEARHDRAEHVGPKRQPLGIGDRDRRWPIAVHQQAGGADEHLPAQVGTDDDVSWGGPIRDRGKGRARAASDVEHRRTDRPDQRDDATPEVAEEVLAHAAVRGRGPSEDAGHVPRRRHLGSPQPPTGPRPVDGDRVVPE
jgi:hypothetical protein